MSCKNEGIAGDIALQEEVTERLAYRLHCDCGMELPLHLSDDVSSLVKADAGGIWAQQLSRAHWSMFFAAHPESHCAYLYVTHEAFALQEGTTELSMKLRYHGQGVVLRGSGRDIFGAVIDALGLRFQVLNYSLCADVLEPGIVAFVEISMPNGATTSGLGVHEDVNAAEIKAMLIAVNHALAQGAMSDAMLVAATVD